MGRPKGKQKTARVTVNLEDQIYGALMTIAAKNDAPLAWVVRRAILDMIERQAPDVQQPSLPLIRSDSKGQGA